MEIRYRFTPCWVIILVGLLSGIFGYWTFIGVWVISTFIMMFLMFGYILYFFINRRFIAKFQINKDNNIMCPQCHNVLKPNKSVCSRCGFNFNK
ncbi:MAG: hypothetical protein R3255_02640 [Candidatus Lokiarchaeia archaeon]|nr:hypothetical protein [Candidatus Lokiarchaeia archaeon]